MRLNISNETETSDTCPSRFIVVYGKSKVEAINVERCSKSSMLGALHGKFGSDIEEVKSVVFHRGGCEREEWVFFLSSHVQKRSNGFLEINMSQCPWFLSARFTVILIFRTKNMNPPDQENLPPTMRVPYGRTYIKTWTFILPRVTL